MSLIRWSVWPALLSAAVSAADFRPPAGTRAAARRPGAGTILPGGRIVTPLGRQFNTGPGAFGLVVSPDGKLAVTANGGPDRYSLTVLDMSSEPWRTRELRARTREEKSGPGEDDWRSVFMGLAFSGDRRLFASEGNSGRVREISLPGGQLHRLLELNQGGWRDSYSGDLAYDAQRRILYVVDQANFRVAVLDVRSGKMVASVRTGRLPFRAALSPDGRRLYVTNIGMFEYRPVPGADAGDARRTGLPFPAFGFPSKEAETGASRRNGAGEEVFIPGLGDPNSEESNSLCVIDVSEPASPRVVRFIRTGKSFGPDSLGGASPSGVVATAGSIYVSNAHQDTITVIDAVTLLVKATIELRIPRLEAYRGILPVGLALDLPNGRLLVAEAGINAVGVVDLATNRLIGHLPAGWWPAAIAVDRGRYFIASAKGIGTGPNATKTAPLERSFQGELRQGLLSVYDAPLSRMIAFHTQAVLANNGFLPETVEPRPLPLELRHVVLVVKENRTYDEVLGDVSRDAAGELRAAPELARFGRRGWVQMDQYSLKTRLEKQFYNITPNHHALVERFAFSDNFYADSEVSVDGHHWLVGSYPNAWTETSLMSSYGGQKDFRLPTSAPGRLQFAQSRSSLHPEEQLEAGALWHHLERHGIPFRNFGEGIELAGAVEEPGMMPTGVRLLTNVPMPRPLWENTSRNYPQYNTNIPDQYRADAFIREIEELYVKPGRELPRFLYIHLPNDHLARPRPGDGYPFQASYMADNDYALGRIVEYLSKTRWWRSMAIFITEDDAQGGVDHVDSHRTVFIVASPFARKNYASRVNASFPALLKTVFRILGLPPLNLFDATAADLGECFSSIPDFAPFDAIRPEPEIFDPAKAKDPADPEPPPRMDDPAVLREQHRKN